MSTALPYWRLSGFYFFYFSLLGALAPYWSLYLKHLNYSAIDIGFITAILMASRIIAPNLWGWLADKTGKRLSIIRWGSFLAALCFVGLFFQDNLYALALVVLAYSFFWNAVLAQAEVVTLSHLSGRAQLYSRIRLWGSIGFIIAVVLLGWAFDHFSVAILPVVMMILFVLIWLASLLLYEYQGEPDVDASDENAGSDAGSVKALWRVVRQAKVAAFFIACLLLQLSHGAYYTFFSIFMEDQGYSGTSIGLLWALGVVAEIVVFLFIPNLFRLFGVKALFVVSLFAASARWLVTPIFADVLWVIVLCQCLHGLTFGAAHAVAIEWVRSWFSSSNHSQGQALYSAFSFGIGGAAGALISGGVWVYSPLMAFSICSAFAFVAALLSWRYITD